MLNCMKLLCLAIILPAQVVGASISGAHDHAGRNARSEARAHSQQGTHATRDAVFSQPTNTGNLFGLLYSFIVENQEAILLFRDVVSSGQRSQKSEEWVNAESFRYTDVSRRPACGSEEEEHDPFFRQLERKANAFAESRYKATGATKRVYREDVFGPEVVANPLFRRICSAITRTGINGQDQCAAAQTRSVCLQDVGVRKPYVFALNQISTESHSSDRPVYETSKKGNRKRSEWIYVPKDDQRPAFIYIPGKDASDSHVYFPTEEEIQELHINYMDPRIVQCAGMEQEPVGRPAIPDPRCFTAISGMAGGAGGLGAASGMFYACSAIPSPVQAVVAGVYIGYVVYQNASLFTSIFNRFKTYVQQKKAGREEKKQAKEKERDKKRGNGGGGDDDKNKETKPIILYKDKKPFTAKYEPNPKHHKYSDGNIGKPPLRPEETLRKSIEVPKKDYRVAIEGDNFIIFQEHTSGVYHGYIVKNFNDLPSYAKNALYSAGLVRDIVKGKIVK